MEKSNKLTLAEASLVVGLSASRLRKFCLDGSLPAEEVPIGTRRIWRVDPDVLKSWKAKHDVEVKLVKRGRKPGNGK